MSSTAVNTYFDHFYPPRDSLTGRLFFRSGEKERRRVILAWLQSTEGLRILDAGCGDGVFLHSLLRGRPAELVYEDLSARAVEAAERELALAADAAEGAVRNALLERGGPFDVVLAIGMLDYQSDWAEALTKLLQRAAGVVIASVPRRTHPRNWLRCVWLRLRGLQLQTAGLSGIRRAVARSGLVFEVRRAKYDWLVRIEIGGAHS